MRTTDIWLVVSVPVLSEQITVVQPSVSTDGKLAPQAMQVSPISQQGPVLLPSFGLVSHPPTFIIQQLSVATSTITQDRRKQSTTLADCKLAEAVT
jgi:hypothetical protein